ncbi:MAG: ATP-binding cassette domain-containing protein, partial [Methylococcaceae bacterium]
MILFSVNDLTVRFGDVSVVDKISFEIHMGETFALVGESGSGKSMTALAALNLLPHNAIVESDSMRLQNENLVQLSEKNW